MQPEYNLKSFKEKFKKEGIFYTQKELALYLKSLIDINYTTVYDPTCGRGSLLSVFDDNISKYGQEINDGELNVANNTLINFIGKCGDTLLDDKFIDNKFDVVIANPPFSIAWQPHLINQITDKRFCNLPCLPPPSRADYAFIMHCLDKIHDNGIGVILSFPGILYRSNTEGKLRKYLIDNNYIEKVIKIGKDKFIDTNIETCIIVLKKNKLNTDITFIDTVENITNIINQNTVIDNDYLLSVSSYCHKITEKETINPDILENEIRDNLINYIRSSLNLSKMVKDTFNNGDDFNNLLNKINDLLNEFGIVRV